MKMKKLFVFAIAAGMFFVACNGANSGASADSTATAGADTTAAAAIVAAPADSLAQVDTTTVPAADSTAK
jgi:hypothetical protein